ncbi:MAG: 50S ribosomal protein L4 [Deltaproteobacteria bacterium RBG_13_52_11]|nr:MAG: 50S ribosomal protein L4 [Deltaproteobacteria bacterium RBG_13_52_11]
MAQCDLYNLEKKKVGKLELQDHIFAAPVKPHLFYEVTKWQLAKRRRGTAATKERSAVSGGGHKPWRQKGTGRARAGTSRSPLWRGGGTIFGPHPRDYGYPLPKKVRMAALRSALSLRYQEGKFLLLEDFPSSEVKTRSFVKAMEVLGINNALIVTDGENLNLERSARNVPWVKVLRHNGLNVFDILKYEHLIILKPAIEKIEERLKG